MMDRTPDGKEIVTHTLWLSFGEEGDVALTLNLTEWKHQMEKVQDSLERLKTNHPRFWKALEMQAEFQASMDKIERTCNMDEGELEELQNRLKEFGT